MSNDASRGMRFLETLKSHVGCRRKQLRFLEDVEQTFTVNPETKTVSFFFQNKFSNFFFAISNNSLKMKIRE